MKIYVTVRSKSADQQIEKLSGAIKAASMTDFCFGRDVQDYEQIQHDPKQLWQRMYDEIGACDALLIDVSDYPTGGRLIETGIAYALRKPIIVVKKHGIHHKAAFDGVSSVIIEYDDSKDLTAHLKKFEKDRNFTITDKSTMLVLFLLLGGIIGWILSYYFVPLGVVGAVLYWLMVRTVVPQLRAFDRIVIFIPLIAIWIGGLFLLLPIGTAFSIAWGIGFWVIALLILQKAKLSL